MKDREGGHWVRDGFALLAPILVVFVLPALDLGKRNLEVLGLHLSMFKGLAVLALSVLALAVLLARFRSVNPAIEFVYLLYLSWAPLWLVNIAAGEWLGRDVALGAMVLCSVLCAAFVRRNPRARDALVLGVAVFGAGLVVMAIIQANSIRSTAAILEARVRRQITESSPAPSSDVDHAGLPDIYHLVFDEFQTDLFEVSVQPDQLRALGGFVFYPETTTPYGRTDMALGATFSGEPFDYAGEPYDYIFQAFNGDRSLLSALKSHGYHTTGLLHQIYPTESKSAFDRTHQHILYGDFGASADQSELFTSLWIVASLPESIVEALVPAERLDMLRSQTLLPATYGYYSVLSLRRYLDEHSTWRSNAPRYVFVHMIVPHQPIALDEDCEERQSDSLTIEGQSRCAIDLILEFAEVLKREGRFENSLIVAHGDHGAHYDVSGEKAVAIRDERTPEWQRARSRPVLLIKPVGASDSVPFRDDPRKADLYDIYPTILEAAGIDPGSHAIGYPLTRSDPPDRERHYHFYRKDPYQPRVVEGNLARYLITPEGPVFERLVPIER
jgi:hypothetical protein